MKKHDDLRVNDRGVSPRNRDLFGIPRKTGHRRRQESNVASAGLAPENGCGMELYANIIVEVCGPPEGGPASGLLPEYKA